MKKFYQMKEKFYSISNYAMKLCIETDLMLKWFI